MFIRSLLTFLCAFAVTAVPASDWPQLRGPGGDGRLVAGAFESGDLGLHLAWKAPLGSGYSGIVLAGGHAVTMYSDAAADWITALDAATGEPRWRYRIDDVTKAHDGSDDGPLSSPAIGGEMVYAIGSRGQLLALRLEDGSLVWSKALDGDFGAEAPEFGFTTRPLVVDDVLVVAAGGKGHSVVGLDRKTGELLWAHGDDGVDYQSPSLMTLAGRRQVVAVTQHAITGLDPSNGELLWTHALGEDDRSSSANPTFMGDDRFFAYISGQIVVFRVSAGEAGFSVGELYRTKELGGSYAPPVLHDGYLYGFKGDFLSCVKADTGERVWRSRPPGGKGLIFVDGQLVVFGAKGNVVIVKATPDGYEERVRFQALDASGLTWPSFAYGRIYLRNLDEIAAINITEGTAAPSIASEASTGGRFAEWVAQLDQAEDKSAAIDDYLSRQKQFPIVDGELVHFLFRGVVEDVALAGSWLDTDAQEPLQQIAGSDLYYKTVRLEPAMRYEYRFQVNFSDWVQDERNSRSVPAIEDDRGFSELVLPGYRLAQHPLPAEAERGRIDTFQLKSEILGWEKEIRVWLPPGYDEADGAYPLLVVNDGKAWLERGEMADSLDSLVGKRVAPSIAVFVEAAGPWWLEAGGSRTDEYVRMQVEELLPALRERYRVSDGSSVHAVLGARFYAFSAAYAALKFPEVFGQAAVHSPFVGLGTFGELETLARERGEIAARFYLDWNRHEERSTDMGWSIADDSRRLEALLKQQGYELRGGQQNDSYGWGGWRNRTDLVLEALFPVVSRSP